MISHAFRMHWNVSLRMCNCVVFAQLWRYLDLQKDEGIFQLQLKYIAKVNIQSIYASLIFIVIQISS